jgi:L-malate glycosyltransferase
VQKSMEKRKKMLVICPHPEDRVPGQRLKYEQYFAHWRSNGFDVEVAPFFSNRMQDILYAKSNSVEKVYWVLRGYSKRIQLLFKIRKYDLVYIFLWVTPFGPPIMEYLYLKRNSHVVYDIDDAIFMKSKSLINRSADLLKGKGKPFFLMKHARQVITCTPFLTDVAKKYNQSVTDISSTINTVTYQPANTYQNDHQLVLGWSGSHSTSQFLYLLKDVLLAVNKIHPFKLIVMGDATFAIPGLDLEAIAWSAEVEVPTLQRFDIGVYPLPLHDDWVLGKSGLKALQYMAIGIPVVATAIGANYRIMEDGKTGFLVKENSEWIDKLTLLMKNPSLRQSIGKMGRQNVLDNYSIQVTAPVYLKILESVCNKNRASTQ